MPRQSLLFGVLVWVIAVVALEFPASPQTLAADDKDKPSEDAAPDTDAKPAADAPDEKKPSADPFQSRDTADPFGTSGNPFESSAKPPAGTAEKKCRKLPADLRSGKEVIEEELARPTTFDFRETPLQDIVDFLRAKHKINIVLDKKALDNVGIGADTPINCHLANVPLEPALNLMLRQLDLTWTIHQRVLLITTHRAGNYCLLLGIAV